MAIGPFGGTPHASMPLISQPVLKADWRSNPMNIGVTPTTIPHTAGTPA